jgi:hypothetical protein
MELINAAIKAADHAVGDVVSDISDWIGELV